jgi:hypothetical protein
LGFVGVDAAGVFDQGVGDVDLESVKLTAQRTAEANEFRQTQVFNFADGYFGDDLFVDGLEVRSEALELVGLDAKNALLRFFEPEEPEFVNTRPGALVPVVESGSGDADLLGDFRDGKSLDAEFDEFVYEIRFVHML